MFKNEEKSAMSKLFDYAGNFKYLTMASLVLSVISAWLALVPFYYIWRIIKEILDVAPFMVMQRILVNTAGQRLALQ